MASNVGPTCHKDQFLNSNISTVNIIGERDGETGEDLPTEESKQRKNRKSARRKIVESVDRKLNNSGSINKITITPPLMTPNTMPIQFIDIKPMKAAAQRHQIKHQMRTNHDISFRMDPQFLQMSLPSTQHDVGSYNKDANPSSQSLISALLPSLAAAQARQMTRKANNSGSPPHQLDPTQKMMISQRNQAKTDHCGISVFGDGLQKVQYTTKQALFKLKHQKAKFRKGSGKKKNRVNSSDNLPVHELHGDGSMVRSPTHQMIHRAHATKQQDEQVSVQKSLFDTTSMGNYRESSSTAQVNQQPRLGGGGGIADGTSNSSGHFHNSNFASGINSTFAMTINKPIYNGELYYPQQGRNSSKNIRSPKNLDSPFKNYSKFKQSKIHMVDGPPSPQTQIEPEKNTLSRISQRDDLKKEPSNRYDEENTFGLDKFVIPIAVNVKDKEKIQSEKSDFNPEKSIKKTINDQVNSQVAQIDDQSPQEQVKEYLQIFHENTIKSDYDIKSPKKQASPFQKFQESIGKLDVPIHEIPTATYLMSSTPGFKAADIHEFFRRESASGAEQPVHQHAFLGSDAKASSSAYKKNKAQQSYASSFIQKIGGGTVTHGGMNPYASFGIKSMNESQKAESIISQHWHAASSDQSNKVKQYQKSGLQKQKNSTKEQHPALGHRMSNMTFDSKKVKKNTAIPGQQTAMRRHVSNKQMITQVEESKMLSVVKINIPTGQGEINAFPNSKENKNEHSVIQLSFGQTELIDDNKLSKMASFTCINDQKDDANHELSMSGHNSKSQEQKSNDNTVGVIMTNETDLMITTPQKSYEKSPQTHRNEIVDKI